MRQNQNRGGRTGQRGEAGGRQSARTESTTVSAAAFEKYLKGADFPRGKREVISQLRKNGATSEIMAIADRFEEREYNSVADVAREFGMVKRGDI